MKKLRFNYVFPYLLYGIILIWCSSLRIKNLSPQNEDYFKNLPGKYILTLWHSRIVSLFYYFRRRPDLNILISPSEDGDLLARLATLMGYTVIRGSTFKNSVSAGRKLIKVLRKNERIVVVGDGSRGPRHKAQPGTIELAKITGSPLIPMTYNAKNKIELNSWDRFVIPFPFTRCALNFSEPIFIDKDADQRCIREKLDVLDFALNRITDETG